MICFAGIWGSGSHFLVTPAHAKPTNAKETSEIKAEKQDLILVVGLQSTLDIEFPPCKAGGNYEECIRIANKQLVTVQYSEDKKQLIFTPVKKGETTVTIRDAEGNIRLILRAVVNDSNLKRRLSELQELLRDIEGIEIKILADKIVVDGEVVVVSDLNRLYAVLSDSSYKDIILNLVTISPVGMQILADKMKVEINNPDVVVRVLNGFFVLEGQVKDIGEANRVVEVAKSMLPGFALPTYNYQGNINPVDVQFAKTKNPILVRLTIAPKKPEQPAKLFRITIDLVELSKDYSRNFGFNFTPSLDSGGQITFGQSTTGGVTTQGNGALSGTIGNLFPKLNTAQNAGYARILEESVMVVKSGKQARLERTLQIPIQTVNDKGQPIFNKVDIGPTFSVTPTISVGEDVSMHIDLTYKAQVGAQGPLPLVLNHTYVSDVVVKSGESAAVVNAISNIVSTSFNKNPTGVTNPLFSLLRSKAFQKGKSQFVIFMTPQILVSAHEGTQDIKTKYGVNKRRP